VVVHPQSVIHSMVTFVDGSTLAQASPPDMKLPIALALAWPHRLDRVAAACDFTAAASWTFEPVDRQAFPALDVAIAAGLAGGTVPAAFNAANEEAVGAFRHGHLRFTGISDLLSRILDEADHVRSNPRDVHDVWATEEWARARAQEIIESMATGWTFEPVDRAAFPALDIAIAAGMAGGTVPAAFNAANEEAVDAFRHGHLRFTGISDVLSRILDEADHVRSNPRDVHDVWATEEWARLRAREIIGSMAAGSTGARASTVWVGASG